MALYAFDGTGNEDEEDPKDKTNVLKMVKAYNVDTHTHYCEGVGTKLGLFGKFLAACSDLVVGVALEKH